MARLGRYELIALLGEGGFGTVHRAWDPLLNRAVAVKALKPHLATNPDFRRRFFAEASAIARLRHANVITIFDVSEDEGLPYFTMELVEGETLADLLLGSEGLPLVQAAQIVDGLAAALGYVHRAGMVHRDLKASNVMVDQSRRVVLMDFGIARALDRTPYTRTGAIMGTPEAMAPEQVLGNPVTALGDVYALGILAYHMLAGRPPFTGEIAHLLYAHAFKSPPSLRDVRPGLPDAVYTAIDSALVKDPTRRCQSAEEFAARFCAGTLPQPGRAGSATPAFGASPISQTAGGGVPSDELHGYGTRTTFPAPPKSDTLSEVAALEPPVTTLSVSTGTRRRSRRPVAAGIAGAAVVALGLAALLVRVNQDGATTGLPSPVAAAATPEPSALVLAADSATPRSAVVALSGLRVYDNVYNQREEEFVPSSSVAACFTAAPEAVGQPITLLVSQTGPAPLPDGRTGVVGRLDLPRVAAGLTCQAIELPGEPLPPAEYRVQLQHQGTAVLETRFRALPPPVQAAASPEPTPATPDPTPIPAPAPPPSPPPVRAAIPVPAPVLQTPLPAPVSTARAVPVQPQVTAPPVPVQTRAPIIATALAVPPAAPPPAQPAVVTVAPAAAPPLQAPAVVTRVAGPPPLEAPATTSPSR